jgi:hypothetical protein
MIVGFTTTYMQSVSITDVVSSNLNQGIVSNHSMNISNKFGSNWQSDSKEEMADADGNLGPGME